MHVNFIGTAFFVVLTCVTALVDSYAQRIDVGSDSANLSVRIQSDNGEFSIELPSGSEYFYDKDGFFFESPVRETFRFREMQMLSAVSDRTYMRVEIYRVTDPEKYVDELIRQSEFTAKKVETADKEIRVQSVALNSRTQEALKKKGRNVNFEAIYASSKTHIFIATVWNRGAGNSISKAFLSSIRFRPLDNTGITVKPHVIPISSLNPLTIRDIAGQLSKEEARAVPENPEIDLKHPDSILTLYSPWAGNIRPINNMIGKGKVNLKVTYGAEAKVTRIFHISGLGGNSSRNAFFAILRSKFLPQERDGKPVSTDWKLAYEF